MDSQFRVALDGYTEPRLQRAAARLTDRLSLQTGIPFTSAASGDSASATLAIRCDGPSRKVVTLGEDESYTLEIDAKQARLTAPNPLGVLRGMETFLQSVVHDRQGFAAAAASIQDRPRFPWRGLVIENARHWMPIEVLQRNIDAMAAVKMNVLHWHISDDRGFRIKSQKFPKLHQMGSDGKYFLKRVAKIGLQALDRIERGGPAPASDVLKDAEKPIAELMAAPAVGLLVQPSETR